MVNVKQRPEGNILVVDDEASVLRLVRAVLDDAGFACDVCTSVRETLEVVAEESKRHGPTGWSPWDALLLDVNLSDGDGFSLLRAIRSVSGFAAVPALFMSGVRLGQPDVERGLQLGALDYLAKPFERSILVAKVCNFAELGRFRREAHRATLAAEESLAWERRQTEIGFGLTSGILAGKPLETALAEVLAQIADLTGFEILTLERFHPDADTIEMWIRHLPDVGANLPQEAIPCEQTLSGRVAKTGEIIEENDAESIAERVHPALRALQIQRLLEFPIRYRDRVLGTFTAGTRCSSSPREHVVKFLSVIADQMALAISWNDAHVELARSRRELHSLSGQLIRALEDERARIARELHDSLGQILTSLSIDADRHAALLTDNEKATAFLARTRACLKEAHATVRHLTASLRPGILDDLGLVAALESYAEEFEQHTGIPCRFDGQSDSVTLDSDRSVTLYRVAQEALTNVARHARARRVAVRLSRGGDGQVRLSVRDDGKGFDLSTLDWPTSYGLLGMRERLQLVGGQLHIVTHPGAGSEIVAEIPVGTRNPLERRAS